MTARGAAPLRIGILGAARIAPMALVRPARAVPRVRVDAIAARDTKRAATFADKHHIGRVVGSYAELIEDPDLDAVYNPLPNSLHGEWTVAALRAGKHVLCEKPLTSNATEAEEVAAVADATDLVLMEAFHYRYHPLMRRAVEIVQGGELGELRHLEAWMQIPLPRASDIRYQLALAGGSLMDLGCYSIHQLRSLTAQEPVVTEATAKQRPAGIDRWIRVDVAFPSGATGRLTVSLLSALPLRLGFRVTGAEGRLSVMNPTLPQMYSRFVVHDRHGRHHERFPRVPTYRYQLEAFADAVLDGAPLLTPPSDSVANMRVIDAAYEAADMSPRR